MKPCGQERAGNMNALWDKMSKNDALWENVLLKLEVKSRIFETFISRQFDTNDYPFAL